MKIIVRNYNNQFKLIPLISDNVTYLIIREKIKGILHQGLRTYPDISVQQSYFLITNQFVQLVRPLSDQMGGPHQELPLHFFSLYILYSSILHVTNLMMAGYCLSPSSKLAYLKEKKKRKKNSFNPGIQENLKPSHFAGFLRD